MGQYRKQLAQPYMVDTSATEQLIDEAYEHLKSEVKASHIMVALTYDALPKDTLVAWNRIMELKKRLQKESFDSVAFHYSDDQSAKTNYGSLGYFTAFDMIYPFEKAAFNTPIGQIYGPFRTQFGYHVIKVFDKRANRGRVNLAHLMLKVSMDAKDDEILRVKQKADSILAEIKTGRATFDEMVTTYSEDYNTQSRKGELGWIGSTDRALPEEFRDAAFNLKEHGVAPYPVLTPYGWHIIKRLDMENIKPKDSVYADFKRKVSNPRDERYAQSKQAVIDRIKAEYKFTEMPAALGTFTMAADTTIMYGTWADEKHPGLNAVMFKLGNKEYTQRDFSKFIEANQQPLPHSSIEMVTKNLYQSFVEKSVWEYEENNLGNKHEKYRHLVQEYHDGILLFNLSEKRVWNKGITDTTGLKEFYEANKNKYMWNERLEAAIYECQSEEICKKVKKWVKKGYADTTISRMAHDIHPLSLAIKTGKFQKGDHLVLEHIKWKKGKYMVKVNGKDYFVVVKQKLKAMPKTLAEARGPITSEYQNTLDRQWIEELKKDYPVTINQATLDSFLQTLPE
jgi:peptidyl-prolyl cis-trans isomerase SurA